MDLSKISSAIPMASRQLNQVQVASPGKPSTSMAATTEPCTEYKVRVPRNLAKKYNMMRFKSGKPDLSSITKASMSREVTAANKEEEALPKSGAGSEYGRERREEARKRRRGYVKKQLDPDTAPWNLKLGGKGGRRYSGKKEAGINDNSSYYILTQCPDGAFEAVPVTSWYNFLPNINYRTLTADEAEEEFLRRDKTVNFFSLMVKKRLQNREEEKEQEKGPPSRKMKLYDGDDDKDSLSEDDNDEEEPGKDKDSKEKQNKSAKQKKGKLSKTKTKTKKGSDKESDASSEEDGYFDSKEVDYMSDSSSSSEDEKKDTTNAKPTDTKDDLNADTSESESEDDEDLTIAGKEGSNPVTPTKRRFIGTPSKTPTKQRRMDSTTTPSKFGMSTCHSPRIRAGLPPIGSSTKKQNKVSRLANKVKLTPRRASARLKAKRQVLGENSVMKFSPRGKKIIDGSVAMVTGSKATSKKDVSLLSCMDYNEFADGLENIENNNNKCRSSMLIIEEKIGYFV